MHNSFNKIGRLIIGMLFVVLLSYIAFERNKVWENETTLWDDNIAKSINKQRAYLERGRDYERDAQWGDALKMYQKAISLPRAWDDWDTYDAYCSSGRIYLDHYKDVQRAKQMFIAATKLNMSQSGRIDAILYLEQIQYLEGKIVHK